MWILGGVIGVFLAIDMFLFFFFWEMMLVPMYFLIALWGHKASDGKTRITAGKLPSFTPRRVVCDVDRHPGATFTTMRPASGPFNYEELLNTPPMSNGVEYLLMLGFFIAFSEKCRWFRCMAGCRMRTPRLRPPVPLTSRDLAENRRLRDRCVSPTAVPERVGRVRANRYAAGCYRHLLWCVDGLRPDRYQTSDRLHLGFHTVLIAIYTGSQLAYQGAVIQMIAHGLSAAGLFILCGQLYERIHTRDMRMMGGLWSKMKWLPALSLFFAAATLGMPGHR